PIRAVTGPRVDDRRLVAEAAQPGDECGLVRGEGGAERDDLRALLVVHARDDVVDRLVALREALLREDVPAELLVADAERLAHVFEVPQGIVRDDDAR